MEPNPFTVSIEASDTVVVARVAGELDIATAPQVTAAFLPYQGNGHRFVADMEDVSFVDSTGLAMLLKAADGHNVLIRNPSQSVQRLLELSKLEWLYENGSGQNGVIADGTTSVS